MSIRIKTLLIIGTVVLVLLVLFVAASQRILLESYQQIDAQNALSHVERAQGLLAADLATQLAINIDYARWDDTYTFITDTNSEYIESTLAPAFITNLGIDFMLFVDTDGQLVFGRMVDHATGEEIALPADLLALLTPDSPLLALPELASSVSGYIVIDTGPLLITASPIVTSLGEGPIRGALLFGQVLDAARVAALTERLRLPVTVTPATDSAAGIQTAVRDETIIIGQTTLPALDDGPGLLVEITMPRTIYLQGQAAIGIFLLLLGIASATVIGGSILLLERLVIARVLRLNAEVGHIGQDETGRVTVSGNDELSRLALAINGMLDARDAAQRTLRERDQRLHTVVNSAPILLWAVDETLRLTLVQGKELDVLGVNADDVAGQKADVLLTPQMIEETGRALRGETFSSMVPFGALTFDTRYTPLCDENEQVIGALGIATDITARTRAEQALSQTARDLEQRERQLERARVLFRSTLDQLAETLQRGAARAELDDYLAFVELQFKRLE